MSKNLFSYTFNGFLSIFQHMRDVSTSCIKAGRRTVESDIGMESRTHMHPKVKNAIIYGILTRNLGSILMISIFIRVAVGGLCPTNFSLENERGFSLKEKFF